MTDNEIIKFIEHAISSAKGEDGFKEIYWKKLEYILDLINRQKSEIERLNEKITAKDENNYYFMGQLRLAREKLLIAKSEAIKEFAERLKNCFAISGDYLDIINIINNLVTEMTE